jgi:hypothetical protein
MGLSSNSLIHLTKTKEAIVGILESNFKLKYCMEEINTSSGSITAGFPMVSFCDIPLSEIKNHITKYGSYGIGLKKEWANRNGLNPVIYVDKHSILGSQFRLSFQKLLTGKDKEELLDHEIAIFDLVRYMKNYQDKLNHNGVVEEHYRYSDEREWRYVPDYKVVNPFVSKNNYNTVEKKNTENKKLEHLELFFEPNDISYVIIEKESEISEFIDVLRKSKAKKYAMEDVERLMTRMVTTEQILSDF